MCVWKGNGPSYYRECLYLWTSSTCAWPEIPRPIYGRENNILIKQPLFGLQKWIKKSTCLLITKEGTENTCILSYPSSARGLAPFASLLPHVSLCLYFFLFLPQSLVLRNHCFDLALCVVDVVLHLS